MPQLAGYQHGASDRRVLMDVVHLLWNVVLVLVRVLDKVERPRGYPINDESAKIQPGLSMREHSGTDSLEERSFCISSGYW